MTTILEQGKQTAQNDLDLALDQFLLTRSDEDATEVSRLLTVLEMYDFMIEHELKNELRSKCQAVPKG